MAWWAAASAPAEVRPPPAVSGTAHEEGLQRHHQQPHHCVKGPGTLRGSRSHRGGQERHPQRTSPLTLLTLLTLLMLLTLPIPMLVMLPMLVMPLSLMLVVPVMLMRLMRLKLLMLMLVDLTASPLRQQSLPLLQFLQETTLLRLRLSTGMRLTPRQRGML